MTSSLPYAHIDSSLRALAGQAEGFGRSAIGGLHGEIYHVTTIADDGPGSLREGCKNKEPLWIVFDVSGTIDVKSNLKVSSYKTIDGRGQRIKIAGKGLRVMESEHVIIANLEFGDGEANADALQIKPNSRHVWIDRCSFSTYGDGLLDITRGSTDITISRCKFSEHDKAVLIGADPSHAGDRVIRVTIHHCFFNGTRQRHPRVRFGKVHLFNNYTRNWHIYAVCASVESQIHSQCNIYEAGEKKVAFKFYTETAGDKEDARSGSIISEGDLFINETEPGILETTKDSDSSCECSFHPREYYSNWTIDSPSDELKHQLIKLTGWQCIPLPPPYANYPAEMTFEE